MYLLNYVGVQRQIFVVDYEATCKRTQQFPMEVPSWELLGSFARSQTFDRLQNLRNNSQQHAKTSNRVCKQTQQVASNNVASLLHWALCANFACPSPRKTLVPIYTEYCVSTGSFSRPVRTLTCDNIC